TRGLAARAAGRLQWKCKNNGATARECGRDTCRFLQRRRRWRERERSCFTSLPRAQRLKGHLRQPQRALVAINAIAAGGAQCKGGAAFAVFEFEFFLGTLLPIVVLHLAGHGFLRGVGRKEKSA